MIGDQDVELARQGAESLAILGDVDRVDRSSPHRRPRLLQRLGQLQWSLPAELHDDPLGFFQIDDLQNILEGNQSQHLPLVVAHQRHRPMGLAEQAQGRAEVLFRFEE